MYLKDILREYKIRPNKRLGQNFLISKHYLEKIAGSIDIEERGSGSILEIGSGSGSLSRFLLEKSKALIAVEKDPRLYGILKDIFKDTPNICIVNADFLTLDLNSYFKEHGLLRIVGNLPYYISTKIIEKIIENRNLIKDGYIMLQREYFQRMFADSGSRQYGRLSIFAQTFLELKRLFRVPKDCFYPKPRVDSYFIYFNIKDNVEIKNSGLLSLITSELFQKRRKKIATIIKNSQILTGLNTSVVMYNLGIDTSQRPEQLPVSDYINITKELER
jgi:16S rRNA (adenine1518-N6/adenine1519-N6)-dimethyltransferase